MRGARLRLIVAGVVALALIAGLIALGNWQVRRLAWKRALIVRVDARVHAPARPFDPRIDPADAAYRHVRVTGIYGREQTLVQAATVRGAGWWVMTPLQTSAATVLVNRGFVPGRSAPPPPPGRVTVVGLLRITEPGGGFLRTNDPAADRWYSRDVAAIARARHLGAVAPYFIDADAAANGPGQPLGGLTVIAFPNHHLGYAITWYGLAVMVAGAFLVLLRLEMRRAAA